MIVSREGHIEHMKPLTSSNSGGLRRRSHILDSGGMLFGVNIESAGLASFVIGASYVVLAFLAAQSLIMSPVDNSLRIFSTFGGFCSGKCKK